jgi:tryptophan synthase beta chain
MPNILEVEQAYHEARRDPAFDAEWRRLLRDYVGRPSPLWFAERLTAQFGGARIYFKREELNHTGAHKINAVLGQILLARRMGKTDVKRQQPNVFRMKLLGAEVEAVTSGAATLKDAMNEALRYWVAHVADTYYCIGTVAGPHPYPMMVRDLQSVIGDETREQMLAAEGRLPDAVVCAVGGGSSAMGIFHPFLDDTEVKLYGVEAAGHGMESGAHAAAIGGGRPGVLHGNKTYLLQDRHGQITEAHSISAGLDYPGIGPEHAWLHEIGRVQYVGATDAEALEAFQICSRLEGIIPALETAHGVAYIKKLAPTMSKDQIIVLNLSGRGDKDIFTVAHHLGEAL